MQNFILQGLGQKLQTSCFRCNKNTWHVESSYILQPPKYLLLFVNRFRYINDNVTKDRCSIPMDTTVRLGPLKFSLWGTIDHHGPSIHSGHYTASINYCKKHSITKRSHNYGVWNYWQQTVWCRYKASIFSQIITRYGVLFVDDISDSLSATVIAVSYVMSW